MCMNLKLTGSVLDDAWKESGQPHMEELIQRIKTILLDATCSRCVYQYGLLCAAATQGGMLKETLGLKRLKHSSNVYR